MVRLFSASQVRNEDMHTAKFQYCVKSFLHKVYASNTQDIASRNMEYSFCGSSVSPGAKTHARIDRINS